MLKSANRLQKSKEVKGVFARGRAFFSPYFLGKHQNIAGVKKFTVVVSTKVSKKAVDRNRIKRVVREQIRLNIDSFRDGSYIFTAKPRLMDVLDSGIASEFMKFLKSSKLLK